MSRIYLNSGRWFDLDAAKSFPERRPLGHQCNDDCTHDVLFRTRLGAWLIEYGGINGEAYRIMTDHQAYEFMMQHGHWADVPKAFLDGMEI